MAVITVIDKRSGQAKTMEARFAKILVALGKAEYAPNFEAIAMEQAAGGYETRHLEAMPKRRGRPPKSLSEQADKD